MLNEFLPVLTLVTKVAIMRPNSHLPAVISTFRKGEFVEDIQTYVHIYEYVRSLG